MVNQRLTLEVVQSMGAGHSHLELYTVSGTLFKGTQKHFDYRFCVFRLMTVTYSRSIMNTGRRTYINEMIFII